MKYEHLNKGKTRKYIKWRTMKMARTKKENPSEVRTSVIRLRVTEDEVKKFKEKAAEAGCRTISQYIRLRCLYEDKEEKEVSG
jgi:hypothetical protein